MLVFFLACVPQYSIVVLVRPVTDCHSSKHVILHFVVALVAYGKPITLLHSLLWAIRYLHDVMQFARCVCHHWTVQHHASLAQRADSPQPFTRLAVVVAVVLRCSCVLLANTLTPILNNLAAPTHSRHRSMLRFARSALPW